MRIIKIVFLICLFSLGAEEHVGIPYSNIERGVPTLAGGCVNVISGDYVESVQDMAIAGPVPLSIDRFFTSDAYQDELHYGWVHNHVSSIRFLWPDTSKATKWEAIFVDKSRGTYKFQAQEEVNTVSPYYHFSKDNFKNGYTNCLSGYVGARSNPKKIVLDRSKGNYVLYHPSLHILKFYGNGSRLEEDIFPHGKFKMEYTHDGNERLKEVALRNDKKEFSKITLDREIKKKYGKDPYFVMTGSDGKKVVYSLKVFKPLIYLKNENQSSFYRISEVRSSSAPTIQYEYVDRDMSTRQMVSARSFPEGRKRSIEYYVSGKNKVDEDEVPSYPKLESSVVNRVKSITEPAGKDNLPVKTYKFIYDYPNLKGGIIRPCIRLRTYVKDFHNHMKCYGIDENGRLNTVLHYKGAYPSIYAADHVVYFTEQFSWSDEGDIRSRSIIENGVVKSAKVFEYDSEGNVICEKQYGNLSGRSDSFQISKEECYRRHFIYAAGLLYNEREDNGRHIHYGYHPNTDLLSLKIVNDVLHYAYEYDQDAVLVREEIGDGATEKRITCFLPRDKAPFGLPQRVDEKYFDFKTGKEHLLKSVEKKFSREGHLLQEIHFDANGKKRFTLNREYDPHGNVTKEQNAAGDLIERRYDKNDNLIYQLGPRQDYHKRFTYDLMNRLISEEIVWGEVIFKTTHEYDPMGQRIATTDFKGNRTEYKYDEEGRVIETIFPQLNSKITQEYDIFGNVTAVTDQRGNTTQTTYNAYGKPTNILYPDGTKESFEYNFDGTLNKSVGKNGFEKTYTYDNFGRLIEEKDIYSSKTFTYNALHKIAETDSMGNETLYSYDGAGRLIEEEKGENKIAYSYDAMGRLHKKIGAYAANVTEYDNMGRVVEERVEDLKSNICKLTQYSYDADGNRIQEIRGESCYQTEYDPLGNPLKVTDPMGNVTTYEYKWDKRQIIEIDPLNNQVITTYNQMEKPIKVCRVNGKGKLLAKKELEYDLCGNLVKTTETVIAKDAETRLVVTEWSYNQVNQIVSLIESGVKKTTYKYNKFGQLSTIIRPDGAKIHHEYDKKGRLKRHYANDFNYEYTYNRNDQPTQVSNTKRVYDKLGRLTSETLENGHNLRYAYDLVNRPTRLTLPDGTKVHYTYEGPFLKEVEYLGLTHSYSSYDLSGYLLESLLPGKAGLIAYEYDLAHRTTTISHPLRSQQNTYDAACNLTQFTVNDKTTKLAYDDLYQLSKEDGTRYAHDSLHNRLKKGEVEYTVNSLNQVVQQGDVQYEYDKNGNLIQERSPDRTVEYAYDALDRLICVKKGESEYRYHYDGFNRRISKEVGDTKEDYIYQINQEIGSYRNGKVRELRILGKGKGAEIGATVAILKDTSYFIPLHNHNGSICALLDPKTGDLVETLSYNAFGEESSSSSNPWRFMSKRYDPETGFIYFGMRFYIPRLGRWLSPDPDGFNDGPNLYAFVRNNPFRNIDLYGLSTYGAVLSEHILSPDLLSGKISYEQYEKQYDFSRPCILSLGRPEPITGSGNGIANGVQTSLRDMVSHMQYQSDIYNGLNTIGFFTPGGSFLSDISMCGREHFLGENTDSVKMIQNHINYFFETRPTWSQFELTAYSRGSIIAYNALSDDTVVKENRSRLSVATFGFAKYMPQEFASRVRNYASSSDPVALLGLASNRNIRYGFAKTVIDSFFMGETAGCSNCYRGLRETDWAGITVLPRHPDEPRALDHCFQSKTYKPGLIIERDQFFKRESEIEQRMY